MNVLAALGVPLVIIAIAVSLIGVLIFVARNYMRCPPNEVLVLYGRKHRFVDEAGKAILRGYRLITGGAAFRIPLLEKTQTLSLNVFQVTVKIENTPNKDGVLVTVDSVANVRISSSPGLLGAAVEQFLYRTQAEIHKIVHDTLEGIVRQLVGTLSVEEMVREREKISHSILELTGGELSKLGVVCQNFVISRISDEKGYIEALGRQKTAEVLRDAEIGEAEAKREALIKSSAARREGEEKRLENETKIADANRNLAVKTATYDAEIKAEQARAALAGEIATAERSKELTIRRVEVERTEVEQQTEVALKRAGLAEKQLIADKIKPAEAEREAVVIRANAEKQANIIKAEALKQAAVVEAEGRATAAKSFAEAAKQDAEAIKSRADAEKHKRSAEGEGQAMATAAITEKTGRAEAEVIRLRLVAEADGTKARGEAEGAAIQAKLLAEALGIEKKNAALAQMSEGARLILVLDRLPEVLKEGGDALASAITPAFQAMGAGLAAVDRIEIVDFGNGGNANGGSALERFAMAIPGAAIKVATESKKLGVDLDGLFAKVGLKMIPVSGTHPPGAHSDVDKPSTST